MKKHSTKQALEIFKKMFEGWNVVTNNGNKYPIEAIDLREKVIVYLLANEYWYSEQEISHIEQTIPMNGDEVTGSTIFKKIQGTYVGKLKSGESVIESNYDGNPYKVKNVELIPIPRKITIEEATELLKKGEKIEEEFEIIKP